MAKEIVLNTVPLVSKDRLQRVMDAFENQYKIHVNVRWSPWEEYRQEFTNIALHRLPADVLIGGTPITSDLIAMNVLRPFSKPEIARLGGEAAFLPSRWRGGMRPDAAEVWAIPFVTDLRILYYNRALLARAGVQESDAFRSPQQLEETLQQLRACGVEYPWRVSTDHYGILHRVASWIWAYGGDLFTPDGKRAIFHEKEALDGLRAYLRLVPYAPPSGASQDAAPLVLRNGQAAMQIEDAFLLYDDVPPDLACAPTPGGSYVGGSDMMIWNHTRSENAALDLVNYLSSPEVTAQFMPESGHSKPGLSYYLPVRMAQLKALADGPNPIAKTLIQSTLNGRTFPCVPMVGLTEDRLGTALVSIQQEVMTNPKADIERLLERWIVSLGKRMNVALSGIT